MLAPIDPICVPALLEQGALVPLFQPIASLQDASVAGYEALVRGPADHPLHLPDALFRAAREQRCAVELELHCVRIAVREFVKSRARGKLWVNMSASAIFAAASGDHGDLLAAARVYGLLPGRIVVEITEHDRVDGPDDLRLALAPFRRAGVQVALDDFGDGRSSLRLWTELRPDLVKIDKHFVRGVQGSNDKFEVVRVLLQIAETLGGKVVAEGVENSEDLAVIRDMGVPLAQGFLLGRPAARPAPETLGDAVTIIQSRSIAVFPEIRDRVRSPLTAKNLLIDAHPVSAETTHEELAQRFRRTQSLHAVAVVKDGRPIGLINRQGFVDRYAQPFYREIYGRRTCTLAMNEAPLLVELDTPLMSLVEVLRGQDQRYLVDGFVLTDDGRYAGLGTGEHLVRAVSELRIEAARHENPLTALPGNIPISEHIARLMERAVPFVACYCDLRNFKPFNDVFGYWRGDEMIRLAAAILVSRSDPLRDFVGHVGGDDFVVLMQSPDWRERCTQIIAEFNDRALSLYDSESLTQGGILSEDRRGNPAFFPFTTIVIGATIVAPGRFDRSEDVASAAALAKRNAKHSETGFAVIGEGTAPSAEPDGGETQGAPRPNGGLRVAGGTLRS